MAEYYVNNQASGADDGSSEADGFLTIQQGMNAVAAGDTVYVKGGVDYTEGVSIATAGSGSSWVTFIGYTSTITDGGQFEIDATGETYGVDGGTPASNYYRFEGMIVKNASSDGFHSARPYNFFLNCEFNNSGGSGFYGGQSYTLAYCRFSNNSDSGCEVSSGGNLIQCVSDGSGEHGLRGLRDCVFYLCSSTSNETYGIYADTGGTVINCTVDGNSKTTLTGVNIGEYNASVLINCIFYDCSYGVYSSGAGRNKYGANNIFYNNGTQYTNWPASEQATDITGDPLFTNEAAGDYTLQEASPARNAGADASGTSSPGMDIGAHQSADAGGGGGGRVVLTG